MGFLEDNFKIKQSTGAWIFGTIILLLGIPCVLSQDAFNEYDYWAGTIALVIFAMVEITFSISVFIIINYLIDSLAALLTLAPLINIHLLPFRITLTFTVTSPDNFDIPFENSILLKDNIPILLLLIIDLFIHSSHVLNN